MAHPTVSFIMATHNRRDVVLRTLGRLASSDTGAGSSEVIVVDNGSTDGTGEAIAAAFPDVVVVRRRDNRGSCAKGLAVELAAGRFIVFLDDDSHPLPGSIAAMLGHFAADAQLGAAGFRVRLPDGREESSALPGVFVGCGVGLRAHALRSVGGLDVGYFMQAEEYDLAFRLVQSGWRVGVFDDLTVVHEKTPQARIGARTLYYDTRNNLVLVDRYLPGGLATVYRDEFRRRYRWLARLSGTEHSFARGYRAAFARRGWNRLRYARWRLSLAGVEFFFRLDDIERRFGDLRRQGVRRAVLADVGKNIYAFFSAARHTGVQLAGVVDDRFASVAERYRGVPLVATSRLAELGADAVVVSNTSFAHAAATADRLAGCGVPVHCWFRRPPAGDRFPSTAADLPADSSWRGDVCPV